MALLTWRTFTAVSRNTQKWHRPNTATGIVPLASHTLRRWAVRHAKVLTSLYTVVERLFVRLTPMWHRIGLKRLDRVLVLFERPTKKLLFDCKMCGDCLLSSTGMSCPMVCPKNVRNGPCGGVRTNGHCEVIPEMKCIWVTAFERSKQMPAFGSEMMHLQPPLNRQLEGSSAWINILSGKDSLLPAGWEEASPRSVIKIEEIETWKQSLSQTAA